MSTTITGKLNKAATQFQAGDGFGFGLRLGVKYYDRQSKQDAWTNYECAVFAKNPAQIQFYQQALVEGAIVEVSGDKLAIKQFQGNNGLSLSIEILDAKLGFVFAPQSSTNQAQTPQQQRPQAPQQPQQSYNQAQQQYQQAPQQPQYNHVPRQQQRAAPPANYQNQMPQGGQNHAPIDFDDQITF